MHKPTNESTGKMTNDMAIIKMFIIKKVIGKNMFIFIGLSAFGCMRLRRKRPATVNAINKF